MSPSPTDNPLQDFVRQSEREIQRAGVRRIISGDLIDAVALDQDVYKAIWTETGTNTRAFAPGYGFVQHEVAEGFADMNLKDDASTPVEIDAELRWVLYADDSREAPMYKKEVPRSPTLRSAVSEARRDKPVIPGLSPFTGEDRVLALEAKPVDAANELTLSAANSTEDLGIPYSRVQA